MSHKRGTRLTHWSEGEIKTLLRMRKSGATWDAIAAAVGRTPQSVSGKWAFIRDAGYYVVRVAVSEQDLAA